MQIPKPTNPFEPPHAADGFSKLLESFDTAAPQKNIYLGRIRAPGAPGPLSPCHSKPRLEGVYPLLPLKTIFTSPIYHYFGTMFANIYISAGCNMYKVVLPT